MICIDLIQTHVPRILQSSFVRETGLCDFRMMILTVMRKNFRKFQLRIINYRFQKHFSNETYRESLINRLSQQNFVNNNGGFQRFYDISLETLNKYAPCKIKHVRGNQMPFFNKKLSKAETYRNYRNLSAKQRNFCVSFKKDQKAWKEIL